MRTAVLDKIGVNTRSLQFGSCSIGPRLQLLLMRGVLRARLRRALVCGRLMLRLARALALLRLGLALLPPLQVVHLRAARAALLKPKTATSSVDNDATKWRGRRSDKLHS